MSFPPDEYLLHMLTEAHFVADATANLSIEQFLIDEALKRATVRSIEIIGEATKQLPDDFRNHHPEFDWRAMAGMRDRLIHGYFGVDYELVWDVATDKIPVLREQLTILLERLDS